MSGYQIKIILQIILILVIGLPAEQVSTVKLSYKVVDTGQVRCYDNNFEITFPLSQEPFFGQDAHYQGNQPAYRANGDGTVTDLNTGLMWTSDPGAKKTYAQAVADAKGCHTGSYRDWRLPTIKELYSLILFSGTDPDPKSSTSSGLQPFMDTRFFNFKYGSPEQGDRIIDAQYASSTLYQSTTMHGNRTVFGVNFADGRIKGYPVISPRGEKKFYVLYVRGNKEYGKNDFVDNSNGTVTDRATGLMWMKVDSGKLGHTKGMTWQQALNWAEDLNYAGYSDWRLPNAKELHTIVDYSRCPDKTGSAAINPVFEVSVITNEGGKKDYPYYWTGTTHAKPAKGGFGVYIAFGRGLGFMTSRRTGSRELLDVHGAGSQRCDFKTGDASGLSQGKGPQGDVMRIFNFVRCVRGGAARAISSGPTVSKKQPVQRKPGARIMNRRQMQKQGRNPGPSPQNFIRRLDKNNDNKVSRKEFDGPAHHFDHLDKNRDGYITIFEAPAGPRQKQKG